MGLFFSSDFGEVVVVPWCADNETYCREVRFSVPDEEWSEFENSQLFQDITQYQKDLLKRIQDKHTERCVRECKEESLESIEIQNSQARRESFWVRVRNRLLGILSR